MLIRYFIKKAHNRRVLVRPRIRHRRPSEITTVERRAVQKDSALGGGQQRKWIARGAAMAAAIRRGAYCQSKSLWETWGRTSAAAPTDIAVISMSGHRLLTDRARTENDMGPKP